MVILNTSLIKSINDIIKTKSKKDNLEIECEFDLNKDKEHINYEIYLKLIRYLNTLKNKLNKKIISSKTINISYSNLHNENELNNYRIEFNKSYLNSCLINFNNNTPKNIYIKLLHKILDENNKSSFKLIRKNRNNKKDILDIEDYNIRFRCNTENQVSNKEIKELLQIIKSDNNFKISSRQKIRYSLILDTIKIELTETKSINSINIKENNNIFNFENIPSNYELEIELLNNNINDKTDKELNTYITLLLKIIQQSNYIITKQDINNVITTYKKLFNKSNDEILKRIDSMNVLSLEIKHLDIIENKYAITDKADGEHSFLITTNNKIYIISQYFHIKDIGITIDKKYNECIFDGELLFLPKKNKYLFMGFDCLFYCGEDKRKENKLLSRLDYINEFMKNLNMNYKPIIHNNTNDINKNIEYYKTQLKIFNENLIKDIDDKNKYFIMRPKLFIPVFGISNYEIYCYTKLYWDIYNELISNNKYPYNLDGIVYQPLNQEYEIISKNIKLNIYKWKPSNQNSIDFYIKFVRDETTHKINTIYNKLEYNEDDDINEEDNKKENLINSPIIKYKICHLYVGSVDKKNNIEIPIYFNPINNNPNNDIHIVYLPIDEKGYVKDREGNIIYDKTVIEFIYDNNEQNKYFRWKPIRTRYDKTENVIKYHTKYGNNSIVASNIWDSIKYPITFDHIINLSYEESYRKIKDELNNLVSDIKIDKTEQYYNINEDIKKIVQPKAEFHNVIKTQLINAYCRPKPIKLNIFDTSIGLGGDIWKYYNASVNKVIGMDIDYNGLYASNGTFNRYKNLKKTRPNVPFMDFLQSNFKVDLDIESQINSGMDKTKENIDKMKLYFKQDYDIISCQFSFHYFLENEKTLQTAINNINKLLKSNGYVLITCFDAQKVHKYLGKDNKIINYADVNGIKTPIHSIERKYNINDKDKIIKNNNKIIFKCGNAIDVMVGEGGITAIEYLVDKTYLINKMKENGLKLIETGTFKDMYENMKEYVNTVKEVETKPKMKEYLQNKLSKYYEDNEINKECKKISFLNRYYVFQKK